MLKSFLAASLVMALGVSLVLVPACGTGPEGRSGDGGTATRPQPDVPGGDRPQVATAYAFRGRVIGPRPDAMSGVAGRLVGPRVYPFVTDRRGYFQLDGLQAGRYRWTVQVPDGVLVPKQVTEVNGDMEAELHLIEATSVEIVVSLPDGHEARELVYWAISNEGQRHRLEPTGKPSTFWWPLGIELGAVTGHGFAPGLFAVAVIGPEHPVRLTMQPGVRLTVRVLDAHGRTPVGQVVTLDPAYPVDLHRLLRQWTIEEDCPVVVDVPPGSYEVSATLPDGSRVAVEVELTEDRTITLQRR